MKLKKLAVVAMSALTLVTFAACGGSDDKDKKPASNDKTTQATKETATKDAAKDAPTLAEPATGTEVNGTGYSITIPSTWEETTATGGTDVMVFNSDLSTEFTANINVLVDPAGASYTPDAYLTAAKKQLTAAGYTVGTTGKCTINGTYATTLEYTASASGVDCKGKQVYLNANKKMYVFTFTDEVSAYANNEPTANSIIASFKLK